MGLWAVYTGAWNPGTGGLCPEQKGRPRDRRFCAGDCLGEEGEGEELAAAVHQEGDAGMLPQVTNCMTHLGREPPPSPSARACPCSTQPAGPGRAIWCPPA